MISIIFRYFGIGFIVAVLFIVIDMWLNGDKSFYEYTQREKSISTTFVGVMIIWPLVLLLMFIPPIQLIVEYLTKFISNYSHKKKHDCRTCEKEEDTDD